MAGSSITGLSSGLDTQALVNALLGADKAKQSRVQSARTRAVAAGTAWDQIASRLSAASTAGSDLAWSSRVLTNAVTSSDTSKVTVSGSPSAGSFSFSVDQLASASLWAVSGFGSIASVVGAGQLSMTTGLSGLGVSTGSAATAGTRTVAVTQASAAAQVSAASVPLVVASPMSLTLDLTGPSGPTSATVTVAAGTYASTAALAEALNAQLGSFGATAASSGTSLVFSSRGQGSDYSLTLSGSAATAWGVAGSTATGSDAVVNVDGTSTTLSALSAGQVVSVGSPTGAVSLTLGSAGGLSVGTGSVTTLAFGAASTLDDVVSAVRTSGAGVNAQVIGAAGSVQMLLSASTSGAAGETSVSWNGFDLGSASRLRAGQDARLTLGGQTLSRSSNVITDLLPGAQISLLGTTAGQDVTVSAALDVDGIVTKVKKFVSTVNDALTAIDTQTKTVIGDPARSGPLSGDSTARTLRQSLVDTLRTQLSSGEYRSLAAVGIQMTRQGLVEVKDAELRAALAKDPTSVAALFAQGVSSADARVGFASAQSGTQLGSYAVQVTAAATRATAVGSAFTSLAAGETVSLTFGSTTATFNALAGMTPGQVASGLSAALAKAGIGVIAEATNAGTIRLSSTGYGSAAAFSVSSTGAGTGLDGLSASGSDVAGTINGAAATGVGRTLTSSTGASSGLALTVSATAADLAAAGGSLSVPSVTYRRGAAGLLRSVVETVQGATGSITLSKSAAQAQVRRLDQQLEAIDRFISNQERMLSGRFSAMEQTLARLRASAPTWPTQTTNN